MLTFSEFGKAMVKPIEIEKEVFNMLAGLVVPKVTPTMNRIRTLIACVLIIGMFSCTYRAEIPVIEAAVLSPTTIPLLLNSGEVQSKEADVNITLWFENGDVPHGTWTTLPTPDWIWTYTELHTGNGQIAATLSGHRSINKTEENSLYQWYTTMAQELAKTGGLIYLDERVNQAMDISSYLSKTNAQPAQWVLIGNLLSIAAYQNDISTNVLAGQDKINIQLLSRGKSNEGRTVLAIPALLKEF